MSAARKIDLGEFQRVTEVQGPRAYEVRNGRRYLESLEDGSIRWWPEYHMFIVDERTGHLMIEGGYGTFSYGWPAVARGSESLHAFLYDLDFGYFMGKASKQPYRVPDDEATVLQLKQELLADRRRGDISRSDAADLWNTLRDTTEYYTGAELVRELMDHGGWCRRLDYSDPSVMVDHAGMRRFWDEVWSVFREEVLKPHFLEHRAAKQQVAA